MSFSASPFAFLAVQALADIDQNILSSAGPVAAAERTILLDSLAIMLAIVVPTIAATLGIAYWYRERNSKARYLPDFVYSGRVELVVWSIPALTILFLGGIAWLGSHELDPAKPMTVNTRPLDVEVVSLDWKWLFIYPQQGVASVNRLVVPAGQPLHFRITSASVFNVFFVPRVASQIYAMNGMVTELNALIDKPGLYPGRSYHFSGDGFSDMHFDTVAVDNNAFANWVSATRGSDPPLDESGYRTLLRQTSAESPHTYKSVSPHLFEEIASGRLPSGEGPCPTPVRRSRPQEGATC